MGEKIYCGLDIGSQRVKAGVLKVKDVKEVELLGVYENKVHGYRDGAVIDLGELSECVHAALTGLSQTVGVKIKDVQVGVSGDLVETRRTEALIPLTDKGGKVIDRRDIKQVNTQVRLLAVRMEEDVLHDFPQSYQVDDVLGVVNPVGLLGRKLGVQSLMIVAPTIRLNNLRKAVHQAGFDVARLSFSSYGSSEVSLEDKDRQEGCVLIDSGAKLTNYLIFKDKICRAIGKINIGGDHLTRSIADRFNLSFDLAEDIKKSHAGALGLEPHPQEEVLVKRENSYAPIKKEAICQAMESDIVSFVDKISSAIKESGLGGQIRRGIIVTGGGSLLTGLMERVEQGTGFPVRLAKLNLTSQKDLGNAALFSSVVGLANNGFKESFTFSVTSQSQANWFKYMTSNARELYQEYF